MTFKRVGLMSIVLLGLAGCATHPTNFSPEQSTSTLGNTTKRLTVHNTIILYRDLSQPAVSLSQDQSRSTRTLVDLTNQTKSNISTDKDTEAHPMTDTKAVKEIVSTKPLRNKVVLTSKSDNHRQSGKIDITTTGDDHIVSTRSASAPHTKRITLNTEKPDSGYQLSSRRSQHGNPNTKYRASRTQYVGFWQWLFGKRKPKPQPQSVETVVPKPDPAIVDQPKEVFFKHAKTDQLEPGQYDALLMLSEQANTTAIYEVRGTAGYNGKTAERIGKERAEFIKSALVNAGVSAANIRIMAYDASLPGLRGVVTVRDGEAI